jgi:hypothetical protein
MLQIMNVMRNVCLIQHGKVQLNTQHTNLTLIFFYIFLYINKFKKNLGLEKKIKNLVGMVDIHIF